MNAEPDLDARVRRSFLRALSESEEAIVNWRSGRVRDNDENRWRYREMRDSASKVLEIVETCGLDIEPGLVERMRIVRAQLVGIMQNFRGSQP